MRMAILLNPLGSGFDQPERQLHHLRRQQVMDAVTHGLRSRGHQVVQVEVEQRLADLESLENLLRGIQPDLVFYQSVRVAPGSRLGEVPAVLERLRMPYSGSPPAACRNAQDKRIAKQLLLAAGICTPEFVLVRSSLRLPRRLPPFPLFVKPLSGGCSYGIPQNNPVYDRQALRSALQAVFHETRQPALVETFLEGREFSIGVIGNQPPQALPIMEYIFQEENAFRSFSEKTEAHAEEIIFCPADLVEEERNALARLALDACRIIGCRDYARVDVRCDRHGEPFVLEVNAHPSLLPDSSFPRMAAAAGFSYPALLDLIVASAFGRWLSSFTELDHKMADDALLG